MNLFNKRFKIQTKSKQAQKPKPSSVSNTIPLYEDIDSVQPKKLTIKAYEPSPIEMSLTKSESNELTSTIETIQEDDLNDDQVVINQIYYTQEEATSELNQVKETLSSVDDLNKIEKLVKNDNFKRKSDAITLEPKIKRRIITDVLTSRQSMSANHTPDDATLIITNDHEHLPNTQTQSFASSKSNQSKAYGNYFSVIYGLFLFLFGVFLSLDTYAGILGDTRVVNIIFFILLFGVSILWIIYLYFDIKAFSGKLINQNTKVIKDEQQQQQVKVGSSDTKLTKESPIYSSLYDYTSSKGRLAMIMSTSVKNSNLNYFSNVNLNEEQVSEVTNELNGYLKDINAPYNLYLRVGIGIFCTVTLLGCLLDMIEALEGGFDCGVENSEALIAIFQFVFSIVEFAFIFTRGNIIICKNEQISSFFMMHLIVTNLIVWTKHILLETLNEYFIEIIREYFIDTQALSTTNFIQTTSSKPITTSTFNTSTTSIIFENMTTLAMNITYTNILAPLEQALVDCYGTSSLPIPKYIATFKPYFYPFIIEFSVIAATIFGIMWSRIGCTHHATSLIPIASENTYQGEYSPNPSKLILLDCTKTFKGLFFGLLIVIMTLLCTAIFYVFNTEQYAPKYKEAVLLSEIIELVLLLMALLITIVGYFKVKKYYTKVAPQTNIFDVILEVLSLCGIYSFSCNQLIAIFYSSSHSSNDRSASQDQPDTSVLTLSAISAILSIIQGTLQTLFILMCLKRYAFNNKEFVNKPARELITCLLLINVSMWFFDTFSAKRFDTNIIVIEHFTTLKWSIINAFSAPIAIFYRFHSSVCLSDIWYCLYYGEHDEHEKHEDI